MLAAHVVVYGDGGGKGPSWPKPIYGRERVAKLIAGTLRQVRELGATYRAVHLNGQPGVVFVDDEDRIGAVMSVDVADGLVQTIRGITNPDKLQHLGRVTDARELLRKRRS